MFFIHVWHIIFIFSTHGCLDRFFFYISTYNWDTSKVKWSGKKFINEEPPILHTLVCLFVCFCLVVCFVALETFSLILTLPIKDLYSALMGIEQYACNTYCDRGICFLWSSHRGPVTLTTVAERLAIELSLLGLSHLWFIHPTIRMWNKRSNRPGHYAAEAIESLYIADMQI